ncbi:MAG: leucyl/phenylalanyl-tRNA--protein transferase [Flavobacteriales bacterium]|nr:leucyl/phenylalanyl-tRNA--protein transferase [Flavobacteriales bacterium]
MSPKLSPVELIYAYSNGYFPMAHEDDNNEIYWHRPEGRGIIPLDGFYVNKNLKRLWKKTHYQFSINQRFEEVIKGCSNRASTWISEEIIEAYIELHKMGFAMSFEVWDDEKLVGGLYGVSIKKAFFGESMFSIVPNSSKLALIFLVEYLKENEYLLLDIQYLNDHTKQFGGIEISDEKYLKMLSKAIAD